MKYFMLPRLETCLEAKRALKENSAFSTVREYEDRRAKIDKIINELQKLRGL